MAPRYTFGRFEVRPDERQLLVDGEPAVLGARALDLLLCLIERRDRVVGKEELLQLVWPGMVVEENNLAVQISTLRKLLGTQALSTVSGRGYRFTLSPSEPGAAPPPAEPRAVVSFNAAEPQLTLPEKPSIAVLPLANLSDQPEQEYFADGVTDDIITELSRFHSLFVIARNSTFTYKGKSIDVRIIAKELGVRYVVEGSIRNAASRIRVTAQLIDSLTGGHIWAEKYDRVLEDIFAVQEELTRDIVVEIAPQIQIAELEKAHRRHPENLSAYDIALRATSMMWRAWMDSDRALREGAIAEARGALAIDSRSRTALYVLATAQWHHLIFQTASDPFAACEEGLSAAAKALELDPSDSDFYAARAWLLSFAPTQPRWDESLGCARRAYELNSNSLMAQITLGNMETMTGNPRRALEILSVALRTSSRDPLLQYVYQTLAMASWMCGEYANGVEYGLRGASLAPEYAFILAHLVLNYVGLGEIDKAKATYAKVYRRAPTWCESRLRGEIRYRRDEDVRRSTTFLRIAAGLEKPEAADAVR